MIRIEKRFRRLEVLRHRRQASNLKSRLTKTVTIAGLMSGIAEGKKEKDRRQLGLKPRTRWKFEHSEERQNSQTSHLIGRQTALGGVGALREYKLFDQVALLRTRSRSRSYTSFPPPSSQLTMWPLRRILERASVSTSYEPLGAADDGDTGSRNLKSPHHFQGILWRSVRDGLFFSLIVFQLVYSCVLLVGIFDEYQHRGPSSRLFPTPLYCTYDAFRYLRCSRVFTDMIIQLLLTKLSNIK